MNALGKSLCRFWESSIGKKLIVAVTGILLVGFLVAHMTGNLLVFGGRHPMNDYAEFLHDLFHGFGIWMFRIVLLGAFVLHIAATIALTRENRAARDKRYEFENTVQASRSSRIMIVSGLTILAFVIFHILHFTIPVSPGLSGLQDPLDPERIDVYGMVILGFQNPLVVLFYIVGVSLLCSHLSHGIASIFQTLGLRTEKTRGHITAFGWAMAIILLVGFLSIPVLIGTGIVEDPGVPDSELAEIEQKGAGQ